jgi:glycosyltransferase involved in cell wall biosynthesis
MKLPQRQVALAVREDFPDRACLEAAGHPVFAVPGFSGLRQPIQTLLATPQRHGALAAALRTFRPDAVVVAMNFALAYPLCLTLRRAGIRLVYLAHDPEPHTGDFAPQWQVWAQKHLARQAEQLIALSHYAAQVMATSDAWRNVSAPAVAPLASLYPVRVMKARSRRPEAPLRLLALGRLVAYKGFDLLAEALAPFAGRDDWRLTIAGDGPARETVRSMFAGMKQVDLSRLGWRGEKEFRALIDGHDVLVCPYRDATQSGVVCEAMAAGMPVLATAVGALVEQVQQGGWLVPDANAAALGAVLATALDDREGYHRCSAQALQAMAAARASADWTSLVFGERR